MACHRYLRPDNTVVGNDLVDCSIFSAHKKNTLAETQAYDWQEMELQPAIDHIDEVQKYTKEHTHYLPGNHCAFAERWAANAGQTGKSLYSLISLKHNVSKNRKNFTYIDREPPKGRANPEIMRHEVIMPHPKLMIVHGWSIAKHAATTHLALARDCSVIYHHTHRMQSDSARILRNDEHIAAYGAGCLCKLQPFWHHDGLPTAWVHGFWIAFVGTTDFTVYQIPIKNSSAILPDGTEIRLK